MENFSQNNEQEVILKYFGDFKGAFLDIGCNDGVTLSNTRALALLGWCGCLVDASPKACIKLKHNYSELETKGCFYMYNYAIGKKSGTFDLNESGPLMSPHDVGLVSTFVPEEMDRFKRIVSFEKVPVKMLKWKTLLNRFTIKKFEMLSLDVEGLEIPILKQMDLTHFRLICVETNGNNEKKTELDQILSDFKVIYTSPENLIYAR